MLLDRTEPPVGTAGKRGCLSMDQASALELRELARTYISQAGGGSPKRSSVMPWRRGQRGRRGVRVRSVVM
jgi:hypothetical protein